MSGLCQKTFTSIPYHPTYALKEDQKVSDSLSEAQTKLVWGALGVEPPPLLLTSVNAVSVPSATQQGYSCMRETGATSLLETWIMRWRQKGKD